MRKRLFYSLFLGAALCMTTACSDDDNNGNEGSGGGNGNGNVPVTTVEQAQEEIDRVGKAIGRKDRCGTPQTNHLAVGILRKHVLQRG